MIYFAISPSPTCYQSVPFTFLLITVEKLSTAAGTLLASWRISGPLCFQLLLRFLVFLTEWFLHSSLKDPLQSSSSYFKMLPKFNYIFVVSSQSHKTRAVFQLISNSPLCSGRSRWRGGPVSPSLPDAESSMLALLLASSFFLNCRLKPVDSFGANPHVLHIFLHQLSCRFYENGLEERYFTTRDKDSSFKSLYVDRDGAYFLFFLSKTIYNLGYNYELLQVKLVKVLELDLC